MSQYKEQKSMLMSSPPMDIIMTNSLVREDIFYNGRNGIKRKNGKDIRTYYLTIELKKHNELSKS